MYLTFQKHYLFRGTMLSKTEFLTFNNKFFYFIYRIVTLNEINMRFYGAEYNNIERGEVQYCCTLLHKTSY
jgi:hypothetical protein